MSRPFKEVILFDNLYSTNVDYNSELFVNTETNFKLKQNAVYKLWSGSIEKFKNDFEIPDDAPLSTRDTGLPNGDNAKFVTAWNWTTLNFKFNYQIWFRDSGSTSFTYVPGSNNTIDLTIPNVLVFNGNGTINTSIPLPNNKVYNPNIFRLPISINSFIISNKQSNFESVTGSGNNSECYLVFRYGINNNDIEICLLTRDSAAFQVNSQSLIIPYASLTFTGFNKIKRL